MAWGLANSRAGMVEVARGRFPDAMSRLEQTVAAMTSEFDSPAAWVFPPPLAAGPILLRAGPSEPAARGGRAAEPVRSPLGVV